MPNVSTENKEANIHTTMTNKNTVYQRNCKSRCKTCEVDLLTQKTEWHVEKKVNDGPSTQKEISVNNYMGSFYCLYLWEKIKDPNSMQPKCSDQKRWNLVNVETWKIFSKNFVFFVEIFETNWVLCWQNMLPRQLLQQFSIWVHQKTQNYQQVLLSIKLIIFCTKEIRSADVQDKTSATSVNQQSCRPQDERVIEYIRTPKITNRSCFQ